MVDFSDFINLVEWWDNVASPPIWTAYPGDPVYAPGEFTDPQKLDILSWLGGLYISSPSAKALMDEASNNGIPIRIGSTTNLEGGATFHGSGYDPYILFNIDSIDNYFINSHGVLVQDKSELTLIHELNHLIHPADSDPIEDQNLHNGINFDFDGPTIDFQNEVAVEMGWVDHVQISYLSWRTDSSDEYSDLVAIKDVGSSYTYDLEIDIVRYGSQTDDTIDMSNRIENSKDLLFGFDGNDYVYGGGGDDFIYGGDGVDRIYGGDGMDVIYGGAGNDFLDGGLETGDSYNEIYGEGGEDVIIMRGQYGYADGGEGGDLFYITDVSSGAQFNIAGADADDELYYNGYRLLGGPLTLVDYRMNTSSDTWLVRCLDANGFMYQYHAGGQWLSIDCPDGGEILIENFSPGGMGISVAPYVSGMVEFVWDVPTQAFQLSTSLPLTSIGNNGAWEDFENLPGYSDTISNFGPNSEPTMPI